MSAPLVGVLLAAGAGRRFGGDKLLQPMADGEPMAVVAARTLLRALPDSLAVLSSADGELAERLRAEGLSVVVNPRARRGIGSSLASGCAARPETAGWVIALADMPYLRTATIRAVAGALETGALLAAPTHDGRRGHPVGFGSRLLPELVALDWDRGARGLLERHRGQTRLIAVRDPGILIDIDTREDLHAHDPARTPALG